MDLNRQFRGLWLVDDPQILVTVAGTVPHPGGETGTSTSLLAASGEQKKCVFFRWELFLLLFCDVLTSFCMRWWLLFFVLVTFTFPCPSVVFPPISYPPSTNYCQFLSISFPLPIDWHSCVLLWYSHCVRADIMLSSRVCDADVIHTPTTHCCAILALL